MIDFRKEELLPLSQLRRHLPGKPQYATLWDWCTRGRTNRATGKHVKLEQVSLPSGMHSSLEAFTRFLKALNAED